MQSTISKYFSNLLLFIFFIALSITVNRLQAAEANINYTGEITQPTCKVSGSNSINLALPSITADVFMQRSLGKADEPKVDKFVSFALSGCPAKIRFSFDGISDPAFPTHLKNQASSDTALGVAIAPTFNIASGQMRAMIMPAHTTALFDTTNGSLEVKVGGEYVRTSNTVQAGKVQTTMQMTILYQ
jgi:type 1 fimbria pilin